MKYKLKVDEKKASKIPEKFDLRKYDKCKKWGIEEWCRAISFRSFIRNDWNKSIRKSFDEEDIFQVYSNFKQHAYDLIDNPLANVDYIDYSTNKKLIYDQSVADLFEDAEDERLKNSLWWSNYLEWKQMDLFSRYDLSSAKPLIERIENTPTWIMKKDQWGLISRATIHVDMDGEDSEIVDKFKDWLKKTRIKMDLRKNPKIFSSNTFSDWCLDRILPCFDLKFYETIHNEIYKLSDITQALFPVSKYLHGNEVYDDDKVKKTIIPKALKIVNSKIALALMKEWNKNNI